MAHRPGLLVRDHEIPLVVEFGDSRWLLGELKLANAIPASPRPTLVSAEQTCYLLAVNRFLSVFLLGLMTALPCRAAEELRKFSGCTLVAAEWSDGDSFSVRFPDGSEHTIRLYGADCIEIHINGDDSNARRLRDQRRYFGIDDILVAKAVGQAAKEETVKFLSKPFTVYTAFADGRGDGRFARIYGFVESAEGSDLSGWLVKQGYARAFGVVRQRPEGTSGGEWREQLTDLELTAARAGRGAWTKTDWEKLPAARKEARNEIAELETAKGTKRAVEDKPIDINTAARDVLMTLPGVGERTALNIIEGRPFQKIEDLTRVTGIGPATFGKIKAFVTVAAP